MRVGIAKPRNPCHENRMASFSLTLRAHTADTHPTAIFIHNGAPQALIGSQARLWTFKDFVALSVSVGDGFP